MTCSGDIGRFLPLCLVEFGTVPNFVKVGRSWKFSSKQYREKRQRERETEGRGHIGRKDQDTKRPRTIDRKRERESDRHEGRERKVDRAGVCAFGAFGVLDRKTSQERDIRKHTERKRGQ